MTQEEILGMSAAQLQQMSDAELLAFFQPKLAITRPTEELRATNKRRGSIKPDAQLELLTESQREERRVAIAMAKELGIDLEDTLPI